jgi:superfamily II DNA or RNA helicase/Holliday junction resolvase
MEPFLDSRRLLNGPWQAFERDVARLLVANGFEDVRIVGGSGDRGADVLGVKAGELWVIQCKFVTNQYPSPSAVDEVVESSRFYQANRLVVAASRSFGPATFAAVKKWTSLGINVELLPAATLIEMARRSPDYPRARRELRPYQVETVDLFVAALRETGRAQVVLATGLGKTVVMAEAVAQLYRDGVIPEGKVLVLAGTRELVDQLQRSFWDQLPKWISTHRLMGGEEPSYWDGITFATVQSVLSRLEELPRFGLVLIDEAHHIGSESFREVIAALAAPMIGGVTATPWRGDGYDIDLLLGQPVARIGIAEGLRKGFLCEADYRLLADNIDWEFVRDRSAHRYSLQQLNRKLLIPTRDEEAAKIIREAFTRERRRAAVIFCSTIVHAQTFAAMLRLFGFRAEAITGDMDPRTRDKTMAAFRRGHLDVVTTRDLFNEGVDVPDVDMIAFMRVTHSRRIFVQQLGRGLRISPDKDKVVVLDFVSDLRRIAEVIALEKAVKGDIETLRLGGRIVQFRDAGASTFMLDWMKDQADLFNREGDPTLEMPRFEFPETGPGGNVQ